ncbi:hypothetical protein GGQ84_000415 [Desulfitispora alkaliphila]
MEARTKDVHQFWKQRELNTDSNVQFGEGGAGTFSDGKLTTRTKDVRIRRVLEELVSAGAPVEILFEQKPHLGTDKLSHIVKEIREKIINLGGTVRFNSKVTDMGIEKGVLNSLTINQGEHILTENAVLAIGHSARDTFELLEKKGLAIEQKPLAMGVRIEHPQELVDKSQYGHMAGHPKLGAADYQLVYKNRDLERSAFTFCMCPGGQVVAAASEHNTVVTNGMSHFNRDTGIANSGLVVSVSTEDFGNKGPLAGVSMQRQWERAAFKAGGANYAAPAQTVGDFLDDNTSGEINGTVTPTYMPQVEPYNLNELLPKWTCEMLRGAIEAFDKKLNGFAARDAVMTGVETRTSSPVRITRGKDLHSVNIKGIYPTGEGAGYAGGIVSAAVDGIRVAEAIISQYNRPN